MRRTLVNHDGLAEAFHDLDCIAAAHLVEQLANHLVTTEVMDPVSVIDQLMYVCTHERPGQSLTRRLSRTVAHFAANCMRFVSQDDTEFIVIEFVSVVPLIYGYDLLCKIGAAHGLVRATPGRQPDSAKRYVSDVSAVGHAIQIWRERARHAIASGYVMEEGDLFLFLDGLARFGPEATDAGANAELHAFCRDVPGGFAYFLEHARKHGRPLPGRLCCKSTERSAG